MRKCFCHFAKNDLKKFSPRGVSSQLRVCTRNTDLNRDTRYSCPHIHIWFIVLTCTSLSVHGVTPKTDLYLACTKIMMTSRMIRKGVTRVIARTRQINVGVDKNQRSRALFLYDGAWGVWKFCVKFAIERDSADHIRFAPIQTAFAQELCKFVYMQLNHLRIVLWGALYLIPLDGVSDMLCHMLGVVCDGCRQHGMPSDLTTAVLFDERGAHKDSSAVLGLFPFIGMPYSALGFLAMCVPVGIRDWAYQAFARRRGAIWKQVKRVTGLGNTQLADYKDRILGLEEPIDPAWGFETSNGDV